MHQKTFATAAAVLLAAAPSAHAGMYTKKSPVLQVDSKSFDRLINKSNHTSIVEFYAPWCGHCQNLKPAYEKAATQLAGLAKVAAIDCDEETNKAFCGSMGVQGFPTLKIVRPGKKSGRPVVEDYQGARTASAIAEAVASKITNHVTRLTDKDFEKFLEGDKPKAILFTEKGTTSALLRSLAIDYLDVVSVAQARNKEKKVAEKFGIDKFPSFVLLPGEGKEPVVYSGELNKKDMLEFLKQAGEPNPDPAPAKKGGKKEKKDKKETKKETKKEEKKKEAKKEEAKTENADEENAEEAPKEEAPQDPLARLAMINIASTWDQLEEACFQPKSTTCVLVFVPSTPDSPGAGDAEKAVMSLTQLNTKYRDGHRQTFPFIAVPDMVEKIAPLKKDLGLTANVELIAVNARRKWWRQYSGDFSAADVEAWVDTIRMGEGEKKKLPASVIAAEKKKPVKENVEPEAEAEAPPKEDNEHDEL